VIKIDYYQQQKEEKSIMIRTISNKPDKILLALNELELKHNINNVLPYYDFVIDLIRGGIFLDRKSIFYYYELYSKTLQYNFNSLSAAISVLKYSIINPFKDLYNSLHWHQKLYIRFMDLIEKIKYKFKI